MFKTANEVLRELDDNELSRLQDIHDFVLLPRLEEAEDRLREELMFRKGVMI